MTKYLVVSWNGNIISSGRVNGAIGRTMEQIDNSILYGIRQGANKSIDDGKAEAKSILRTNDAMGVNNVLFNSIRSDLRGKNYFYLIAGHGMGIQDRYPLYIEKGFRPHFVPLRYIQEWLIHKASPSVIAHAQKRGGLIVGRDPKWRRGLRFMEGAFGVINNNVANNVKDEIINNLQKMRVK